MCAVHHSLFTLSLGVIGRLCSIIVAIPGHLCCFSQNLELFLQIGSQTGLLYGTLL